MYCAIGVEPTNEIALTLGCASRRSTATLSPCTTLNTPGGRPASRSNWAQKLAHDGSRSLGLSTNVFPPALAAESTASSTIDGVANATLAWTSPVAGLKTSPDRSDARSYALPSIQWVIIFVVGLVAIVDTR